MKLASSSRRSAMARSWVGFWVPSALCVIAILGSSAAAAEEPGVAALLQRVNTLDRRVQDLQARVKQLEAKLAASSATTPAASAPVAAAPIPPAAKPAEAGPAVITAAPAGGTGAGYLSPEALLRQSWSRIDNGMAAARVHELLGEPSKKFKLNGRTVWYYYYPATGVGSVFFTDAGRVSSKQSPFGWSW